MLIVWMLCIGRAPAIPALVNPLVHLESLDSAALAFLVGVSLEHQKEKDEEEEEETGELYPQRASLDRHHSGAWSPIDRDNASRTLERQRFTFLNDHGEIIADLPCRQPATALGVYTA